MDMEEKESIIDRICCGYIQFSYKNNVYYISTPSLDIKYQSNIIYKEALEDAHLNGIYNAQELQDHLYLSNIWTDQQEKNMADLEKDIENFKVGIYQAVFKTNDRNKYRKALEVARVTYNNLYALKHSYDHVSAAGCAGAVKIKFLIGMSLLDNFRQPLFSSANAYFNSNNSIVDQALFCINENRISENIYRELVQSEPWRSIWSCSKINGDIFGKPVKQWSDEQKNICLWSRIYDSIHENSECPTDDVVLDNDAIDGWMILQRRKRGESINRSEAERMLGTDKHNKADEVYIPAQTVADAAKIESLNDASIRQLKKQRDNFITNKGGQVKEVEFPDMQQKLRIAMNQKIMEKARNK